MKRIKLLIEYDGTQYVGWQSQQNGRSIQFEIEEFDAIKTLFLIKTFGPMEQFDSIITLLLIIEFS